MAALLSSDTWLAQVLGFPCFRLSSPASPADVPALVDELNRQVSGSAFAYVKVATRAVNSAAIFTDNGFNIVDVSVTFERPP